MTQKSITTLPKYEFNIRSFHPEKDFGWSGLKFKGDNRGFSNLPSGRGRVSSRIWHKFILDTESGFIIVKETRSDPSKAPWDDELKEYKGKLQPQGRIMPVITRHDKNGINHYRIEGQYGGENHAMPGSSEMKELLDMSYVPTLNVKYKILIDLDRINKNIDIVTYITGDGFPNCEAFVVDEKGHAVFLGTHVRLGAAPVTLMLNLDYPMIVSAIRLPINNSGVFTKLIGDELERKNEKKSKLEFKAIDDWNDKFRHKDPNNMHCMALEKMSLKGCF